MKGKKYFNNNYNNDNNDSNDNNNNNNNNNNNDNNDSNDNNDNNNSNNKALEALINFFKKHFGFLICFIGQFLIITEGFLYFSNIKIITDNKLTYLVLIPLPAFVILELFIFIWSYLIRRFNNRNRYIILLFRAVRGIFYLIIFVLASISLYIGGGWYFGCIYLIIGLLIRIRQHPTQSFFGFNKKLIFGREDEKDKKATNWKFIAKLKFHNFFTEKRLVIKQIIAILFITVIIMPFTYIFLNYLIKMSYRGNISIYAITGVSNYNNTLYMTPIFEVFTFNSTIDNAELEYMRDQLGDSGPYYEIGFSVSCWYSENLINHNGTWDFNPQQLYYKLNRSLDTNMPVLFHMNGGNWGTQGMSNDLIRSLWLNDSECQWDQYNNVPIANLSEPPLKKRLFSLQRDTEFNKQREYHLKQATTIINKFYQEHPNLFIGCSLDSEIHINWARSDQNDSYYDYNPLVIQEYREWLKSRYSLEEYNAKFNQNNPSFTSIDAPRKPNDPKNKSLWEEWTLFRHHLVKEAVELQAKWLHDAGIPKNKIFSHQILSETFDKTAYYERCDTLETNLNDYCGIGVTKYGYSNPERFWTINQMSGMDWGIFEWNLYNWERTQEDYYIYMNQLKAMYKAGIHVICPNGWFEFLNPPLMIRNNTIFINALKEFGSMVKGYPRSTSPNIYFGISDFVYFDIQNLSEYFDENFWLLMVPFGITLIYLVLLENIKLIYSCNNYFTRHRLLKIKKQRQTQLK
ncbi:MAG: hypothetical protein ACTSO2_05670 [Promethearchaeota archaeon]